MRLPVLDRANAGFGGNGRRGKIRLARTEVDHVFAGSLAALGFGRDSDRGGGFEVLQVGRKTVSHERMAPLPCIAPQVSIPTAVLPFDNRGSCEGRTESARGVGDPTCR